MNTELIKHKNELSNIRIRLITINAAISFALISLDFSLGIKEGDCMAWCLNSIVTINGRIKRDKRINDYIEELNILYSVQKHLLERKEWLESEIEFIELFENYEIEFFAQYETKGE